MELQAGSVYTTSASILISRICKGGECNASQLLLEGRWPGPRRVCAYSGAHRYCCYWYSDAARWQGQHRLQLDQQWSELRATFFRKCAGLAVSARPAHCV